MTLSTFISDMREEMELLFSEWRFKDENAEKAFQPVSVFEQSLPIPVGEDEPEPFPYIVVRAEDGGTASPEAPETVRVRFVIGIFDDNSQNRAHIDVFNMIDRIRQRFEKNPLLRKQYYKLQSEQYPTRWAVPDDDTFPYFFGVLEMYFAIPKIETEAKNI